MDARAAFDLADHHTVDAEVDALFTEVVRLPSVHTELMESDPEVKAFAANFVAPRLGELTGLPARIDGMGNVLWRREGAKGETHGGLAMMGYAMTFPAGSMPEPFSAQIVPGERYGLRGPCVWGRGGSEQKGPLAAMLAAVAVVQRSGVELARPFSFAVSLAGETGRHDAARHMLAGGLAARCGIVGLGTGNRLCLGNKGRIDIDVVVRGRSCHSSMPWQGVNAVDGARAVLDRLDGLTAGLEHPELGEATLVATHIESGPDILHTIQDVCRITFDRRLLPGEKPESVLARIRESVAQPGPCQVDVIEGAMMYPSDVSPESETAQAIKAVCEAAGADVRPVYSPAALDAGYLNHEGIETVMFGPGDLRFAHSDAEVVPLEDVRLAARIYAATALTLLVDP
jgi:acetylornithine deacetylase/succinyl-diaminopimelate desuccinylase-like protein